MKLDLDLLWNHLPESARAHVIKMDYSDVLAFAEAVAVACPDGHSPPFIDASGNLCIPLNAPAKYRWWQGGQSPVETLRELNAPEDIIAKYKNWRDA